MAKEFRLVANLHPLLEPQLQGNKMLMALNAFMESFLMPSKG
jgi:hypothetical protein